MTLEELHEDAIDQSNQCAAWLLFLVRHCSEHTNSVSPRVAFRAIREMVRAIQIRVIVSGSVSEFVSTSEFVSKSASGLICLFH